MRLDCNGFALSGDQNYVGLLCVISPMSVHTKINLHLLYLRKHK